MLRCFRGGRGKLVGQLQGFLVRPENMVPFEDDRVAPSDLTAHEADIKRGRRNVGLC